MGKRRGSSSGSSRSSRRHFRRRPQQRPRRSTSKPRRSTSRGVRPAGKRSRSRSRGTSRPSDRKAGGVKLFVGRLPPEATQRDLRRCFQDFGDVLEVFLMDSSNPSTRGCAFVRMARLDDAQAAIRELHEQKVLLHEYQHLGAMQVAFAKGEATRLGLEEEHEKLSRTTPSNSHGHGEDRLDRQRHRGSNRHHQEDMRMAMEKQQQNAMLHAQLMQLPPRDLVDIVKEGQRSAGRGFHRRWRDFCDVAWGGTSGELNPSRHPPPGLAHFIVSIAEDYRQDDWLRGWLRELPPPPPGPPLMPMFPPPPGLCGAPFGGMLPPPGGMPFPPPGAFAMGPLGVEAGDGSWFDPRQEPSFQQSAREREAPKFRKQTRLKFRGRIINTKTGLKEEVDDDEEEETPAASQEQHAAAGGPASRPILDYSGVDTISIPSDG